MRQGLGETKDIVRIICVLTYIAVKSGLDENHRVDGDEEMQLGLAPFRFRLDDASSRTGGRRSGGGL